MLVAGVTKSWKIDLKLDLQFKIKNKKFKTQKIIIKNLKQLTKTHQPNTRYWGAIFDVLSMLLGQMN